MRSVTGWKEPDERLRGSPNHIAAAIEELFRLFGIDILRVHYSHSILGTRGYTPDMPELFEKLAAELERPRELSKRVMNYVTGTYGIDYAGVGPFLADALPKLEDDEVDLVLSPVFTPKLADQAPFAELLGSTSIPGDDWPAHAA